MALGISTVNVMLAFVGLIGTAAYAYMYRRYSRIMRGIIPQRRSCSACSGLLALLGFISLIATWVLASINQSTYQHDLSAVEVLLFMQAAVGFVLMYFAWIPGRDHQSQLFGLSERNQRVLRPVAYGLMLVPSAALLLLTVNAISWPTFTVFLSWTFLADAIVFIVTIAITGIRTQTYTAHLFAQHPPRSDR